MIRTSYLSTFFLTVLLFGGLVTCPLLAASQNVGSETKQETRLEEVEETREDSLLMERERLQREQVQDIHVQYRDSVSTKMDSIRKQALTAADAEARAGADKGKKTVPQQEREALVALYNSTDGDNWEENENWLSDAPVAEWYGVYVENGHVEELLLPDNGLRGNIPKNIGKIRGLEGLNLRYNNLGGSIPNSIGKISKLKDLRLHGNNIGGEIPKNISNLSRLEVILLFDNNISGVVPEGIGGLSNLELLLLGGNNLSGGIPSELGQLSKLRELNLRRNSLTGKIPSELGQLEELELISLAKNSLSGEIPAGLSQLSDLIALDLDNNGLTGKVPSWLGQLSKLEFIDFVQNDLTGEVPSEVSQLSNLETFVVSDNDLSGPLPAGLKDIPSDQFSYLWFDGTEICEPADSDFQNWLDQIENLRTTGKICDEEGGLQVTDLQPSSGASLNWEESLTLTATITDDAGDPVEGATLLIEDNLQSLSATSGPSDENGKVSYEVEAPSGVSEGKYSLFLTASKDGFEDSEPKEFIAEVDLPSTTENLLDAIANIAADQIGDLRREYEEENIKHLAYLGAGIVGGKSFGKNDNEGARPKVSFGSLFDVEAAIYVDVDDLLQITEEGKDGKVTTYLDVGASGPTVGLPIPVTVGLLKVPFDSKAEADPDRSRLSFKLADLTAVVGVSAISVNSKGEYKWAEANTSSYELNLSASVLKLNWNFLRGEMSSNTLTQTIEENLPDDLSEVSKEDFDTKSILKTFAEASDQKGISYQEALSNGTVEPFTRSDGGEPRDVDASITYGRGGFDADGNGLPDNQCPVPADNFSRIPKFDLNFITQGTTAADYVLIAESIPEGWAVETRDGSSGRSYLSKLDVPPGTEVTTNWNVYQESEGNPEGRFRFVLYQGSLVSNDPLDTLLVDVETYEGEVMAINGKSPVDLEVGLPDDSKISKNQFDPLTANYTRTDIDGSGDTDTQVLLADPPEGEYEIGVVPADTARPTDTYTLEVGQPDGSVDTLVADQEVQDTPDESYVTSQEVPVSPSSLVANANDDNYAQLEWAHRGDPDKLSRYRIYRDTAPFGDSLTTQAPIDSVGKSSLKYTDESAEPGDTYYYRVTSVDESGTESKLSDGASIFLYPQQVPVDAERSFDDASGPEDYQLVALPGRVDKSISDVISGEAGADWQAFWDDGSAQSYLQRFDGSSTFTFRPGTGFWLTSRQDWTFEENLPTVQLQDSSRAAIEVHEGWNIVSNPLDKDVSWAAVDSVNDGSLRSLWKFNGSFSQADTLRSAKTGSAFYFLNDTSLDSLQIPYPGAPSRKTQSGGQEQSTLFALRASPKSRKALSSTVRVGIDRAAEVGLDKLDRPAPPGHFSAVNLRLKTSGDAPGRQQLLMTEQKPPNAGAGDGHTFDLLLRSKEEGAVQITAGNLKAVEGAEVRLLYPSTGRSYDLKTEEPVTLQETDSTALQLAVGSEAFVQEQAEKIAPDEVTITSYPNPMRKQATLEYTVPEAKNIRLTVYDVLGRRVATLDQGKKEVGRHRVRLQGRQLSSGVYFGRLKVGSQMRTQKITVVR